MTCEEARKLVHPGDIVFCPVGAYGGFPHVNVCTVCQGNPDPIEAYHPYHNHCRYRHETGERIHPEKPCFGTWISCGSPKLAPGKKFAKKFCGLGKCTHHESRPYISVIIPARNEGDEVRLTIQSMVEGGADQIIVVDDASTDACCDALPDDVLVLRNDKAQGPAQCRNRGAAQAGGRFIMFSDAHVRVPQDGLRDFCEQTIKHNGIICAAVRALNGRDWTGYGGRLVLINKLARFTEEKRHRAGEVKWKGSTGYAVHYNLQCPEERVSEVSGVIGSVYCMTWDMYYRLDGWIETISHGYNEQALSLKAFFLGIPMFVDRDTVIYHQFRQKFPYQVGGIEAAMNRCITHFLLFEPANYEATWKIWFNQALRRAATRAEPLLASEVWQKRRADFLLQKVRSDDDLKKVVGKTGFQASRKLDGRR